MSFAGRSIGLVYAGALALLLGLLPGCAGTVTKDSPIEARQEAAGVRAAAKWNLILAGNAAGAYEYLSPASRKVVDRTEFVARMQRTAFRTATVEKSDCSVEVCQVWVAVTYDHPMMKGVRNTLRENWILENGTFWFVWQ
jgi:hypothetical protein